MAVFAVICTLTMLDRKEELHHDVSFMWRLEQVYKPTIYVWSICHATSGFYVVQCVEKERDALLQFKHGITVDHCGLLDSWGPTLDCCLWDGIRCNSLTGHVTTFHLPGKGFGEYGVVPCLEGTINVSLVELIHLKYLDLSLNSFLTQSIPKFIGSLSNLRYLNLSNAGFSGIIPNEIGYLSRLSSLDLSDEYNNGFLSVASLSWVSHLKSLREINLGGINLSDAANWVSIINTLPLLEVLRLDYCNLPLKLPSSLSYINTSTTLRAISLKSSFNLDGSLNGTSIFHWICNICRNATSLAYLDLYGNSFQGTIPSFIGKMKSLSHLDLGENDFSGQVPSEIWTIDSLSYLSLSYNRLEGSINNTISNLKYLTLLDLSHNKFQISGRFMKSLGKLCRLQTLRLDNNIIKLELSEVMDSLSLCAYKSLASLTLSNTQLNGTISECIGRLSRLELLDLSSNFLNGVVSRNHFSNLSNLQDLHLSYNHA